MLNSTHNSNMHIMWPGNYKWMWQWIAVYTLISLQPAEGGRGLRWWITHCIIVQMHYRPPVLLCFQLRIRCTSFLYLNVSVNSSSQNTVQVFTLDCPWIIPGLAVLSLSFLWVPRQGSSEFVLGAPRSSEIAAITIRECSDDIYRESFVSLHCIELCVAFFGSRQRPLVGRERQWAGKSCWWIVSSDLWEQVRLQTAYASEEVVRLMFFFLLLVPLSFIHDHKANTYSSRSLSDQIKSQVFLTAAWNDCESTWEPSK